ETRRRAKTPAWRGSAAERRSGEERRADLGGAQLSLGRRLRQRRTIISLVLPLLLLVFCRAALAGFGLERLPSLIMQANPLLLLAAFMIFYAGFPLRPLR